MAIRHAIYVQWPGCLDACGRYNIHPCIDAGWIPNVSVDSEIAWVRANANGGWTALLDDLSDAWATQGPDDNGHYPAGVEVRLDGGVVRAILAEMVRFVTVERTDLEVAT